MLPLLAVYAATALALHVPLLAIWWGAFELLAALSALAAFAALINDYHDLEDDRSGGKPNVLSRHPKSLVLGALAAAVAVGCVFAWLWRDDLPLDIFYVAAWMAFVVYSVPPIRLKLRGGWGVIAVALGEAALPSVVAALLCGRAAESPVGLAWTAAIALWSFCHGMRAILWHQLGDEAADARASVETFVRRRGAAHVRGIVARRLFPVEIASLAWMFAMIGSPLPWIGLALYLLMLWARTAWHPAAPAEESSSEDRILFLHHYYRSYFLLSLIAAAAVRNPADSLALLLWLILFPRPLLHVVEAPLRLLRRARSVRGLRP